jgi:glycopeptide antibiotics resistance protein
MASGAVPGQAELTPVGWIKVYAEPIGSAAVVFALLGVALALPYLAWQYRRRGTLTAARAWAESSFVLYLLCAWALILLPFPEDPCLRTITTQFQPFHWLELARSQSSGAASLLTNPNTVMFAFNIALLFPLGVYLRRWFRRGVVVSTLIGFGMSLAFEITQYTAIFGVYECTYRQFNVDDLMANTTGALLGWLAAPLVFVVPWRGEDPTPPTSVTVPRRVLSCVLDFGITWALTVAYTSIATTFAWPVPSATFFIALLATCLVVPLVTNGRTPGQFSVGIRTEPGRNLPKQAVRWLLVWGIYPALATLAGYGLQHPREVVGVAALAAAALLSLWPLALLIGAHERLSGTRAVPERVSAPGTRLPA